MTHNSLLLSFLKCSKICENFEGRTPFLELQFPVKHDRGGHYDEMRTPVALLTCQVSKECYRLDCLACEIKVR